MTPQTLEDMIRSRAYEIWVQEGCPDGRAQIHWIRAEAEFRERLCCELPSDDGGLHSLHRSDAENLIETRAQRARRKNTTKTSPHLS